MRVGENIQDQSSNNMSMALVSACSSLVLLSNNSQHLTKISSWKLLADAKPEQLDGNTLKRCTIITDLFLHIVPAELSHN